MESLFTFTLGHGLLLQGSLFSHVIYCLRPSRHLGCGITFGAGEVFLL